MYEYKYHKYKLKYLNVKNNLIGGNDNDIIIKNMEDVDVLLNYYNKLCIEIKNNKNNNNNNNNDEYNDNLNEIIKNFLLLIELIIKTNNNEKDLINLRDLLMSMLENKNDENDENDKNDENDENDENNKNNKNNEKILNYNLIIKNKNKDDKLENNNNNVNLDYKKEVVDIILNFYNYLCIKFNKTKIIFYNNLLVNIIQVLLNLINLKVNNNNDLKVLLMSNFKNIKERNSDYKLNYNLIIKKDNTYIKLENYTIEEIKSDNNKYYNYKIIPNKNYLINGIF